MDTLQIKKDAAITAYDNARDGGKRLLEDLFGKQIFIKDIRERINSLEDIFELNKTSEKAFNVK